MAAAGSEGRSNMEGSTEQHAQVLALEDLDLTQTRLALDACISQRGRDHQDTIGIMSHLVNQLLKNEKPEEALALAQHVHTYMERLLPEGDPGVCASMLPLATCLKRLGRLQEAEQLLIKALDITQRALGHEHPETIQCCTMVAMAWNNMGKYAEAEALHRRAQDFHVRLLGPTHPVTLNSMAALGDCLVAQPGKVDEGIASLHKALELHIRAHGLQHHNTISCIALLGKAYLYHAHDYVRAERTLRQGLQLSKQAFGPDHQEVFRFTDDLAACLSQAGKQEEALPVCQELLPLLQRYRGNEHPSTLHYECQVVTILINMGRFEEAAPLARRGLEACTRVLGREDPVTKQMAQCHDICSGRALATAQGQAARGKSRRGGRR